jgi:hypothetical protein
MTPEADQSLVQPSVELLKWLGVTSVAGFLGLYASWLSFPPELVVDGVVDKSKKLSSESRIKIKNNGKLPAVGIGIEAANLCATVGSVTLENCAVVIGPHVVSRLSNGESAEISVTANIHPGEGAHVSAFSYLLTLKYSTKLFFLRKAFKKQWRVQLKTFEDGFAWHVTPA